MIIPGDGMGTLKRSHKVHADLEAEVCTSDAAITGPDQLLEMQSTLLAGMWAGVVAAGEGRADAHGAEQ